MTLRLLTIAAVVATAACASAVPPAVLPPSLDAVSLPIAARAALNAQWPNKGWQVATLNSADVACPAASHASSVIVTSDFDSDGLPDIAMMLQTPKGVRLVALLARSESYHVFDLDGLGDTTASAGLTLSKRGDGFMKHDTNFEDYFSSDTVTTVSCSQGLTSYQWTGLVFDKVPLTSVTPAAVVKQPQPFSAPR